MKKLLLSLLLGLSLTTQISYAALTDQLIHYYSFDSATTDLVGSNNGTDTNSPTYTAGKISNAFTAVAASSQYTTVANSTIGWGSNTLTVNFWVKMNNTAGNQSWVMVARTGQGLIMYKSGTNSIDCDKPNVVGLTYTWTAIDTNWHMWTCVSDGSGMRIYLDGNSTPVASNANTANWVDPAGDTIPFGAYKSGGVIQAGWYLDGQLDEMGIWTRALSTSEIAELYNSGAGLAYPFTPAATSPTTLGFFRFFKRF